MKRQRNVTQQLLISVDKRKFTPEFLKEFNESMFDFGDDIEKHIDHIAKLYSAGIIDENSDFIEGYGNPKDMKIRIQVIGVDCER